MTRKLWLGMLGLILLTGGVSLTVAADTTPSIRESEKAWGAEYPKLFPVSRYDFEELGDRALSCVVDSRQRLYLLTTIQYVRDRFERRDGMGFEVGNPFMGILAPRSPEILLGTDDIPRAVFTDFTEAVYLEVLGEDPAGWVATRVVLPPPSSGDTPGNYRAILSVSAASTPDGLIHVLWALNDYYYRDPERLDDDTVVHRIFHSVFDQGSPTTPPAQVRETVQIYASPEKPAFSAYATDVRIKGRAGQAPGSTILHAVWRERDGSSAPSSRVYYFQNTGSGWSAPEDLGTSSPSFHSYPLSNLVLLPDGRPILLKAPVDQDAPRIYLERSAMGQWLQENIPDSAGSYYGLAADSKGRAIILDYFVTPDTQALVRREAPGTYSRPVPSFAYALAMDAKDDVWTAYFIVSGGGGGQFRASRTFEDNLGAQDALALVPNGPGAFLNAANGNQSFSLPLFNTRGRGIPASLALHYNALQTVGDLGLSPGWCHSDQMFLTEAYPRPGPAQLVLHRGDGSQVVFDAGPGAYLAQAKYGEFSRIQQELPIGDTTYAFVLTDKSGVQYGFGIPGIPSGSPGNPNKLRRIRDTNGNELNLAYGDNPLSAGVSESNLLTATDSVGRVVDFTYDADNLLVRIAYGTGFGASRAFTLAYDPTTKKLISVEDSAHGDEGAHIWRFEYHATNDFSRYARKGLLSRVIPPKGPTHAWQYGYQGDNRCVIAQDPAGKFLTCEYSDPTGGPYTAKVRDRKANADPSPEDDTTLTCDFARSLATRIDLPRTPSDTGARPFITRTFDQYRNELTFTDARGNATTRTYAATAEPSYVKDNLASVQRPGNDLNHRLEMTYTMDGLNRLATVKAERKAVNPTTMMEESLVTAMTYDPAGNLLTRTHPHAAADPAPVETFRYDGFGRPLTYEDPNHNLTRYDYDGPGGNGTGLVTSITRPNLLPETSAYDARGNRTGFTSMAGGSYASTFDLRDRPTGSQEPNTPASFRTYDLHDLLVDSQDARGYHTTFTYDLLDRLEEERNALWPSGPSNLNRIKRTYDPNGNVLTRTDLRDHAAMMSYDARNRLTTETSPDPGTADPVLESRYAYDGNSNLVSLTREGGSLPDQVTTMAYDARNNLVSTTYPAVTDLEAPPSGSPVTVSNAVHVDETRYDESDLAVLSKRTSNGAFRTASGTIYDFRGLPRETRQYRTDPDGSLPSFITTRMAYDLNTNLIQRTDPDGRTWRYGYDVLDRQTTLTDAHDVVVSRTVYTDRILGMAPFASSVETLIQDPANAAATPLPTLRSMLKSFNLRGDLVETRDAFDQPTAFIYDENHNLRQTLDAENHAVEQAYDALNRLSTTVTHPTPQTSLVTTYILDENGNRTGVLDPRENLWRTDFDVLDRPIRASNPGSNTFRTMSYNAFGLLKQAVDEGGRTRLLAYDSLNRPTREDLSGGLGGNQTLMYAHDGADRRTQEMAVLGMGSASLHRYDALSRQTAQEDLSLVGGVLTPIRRISTTYTDAGDPLTVSTDDPALGTWTWAHDEDHLPKEVRHSSGEVHAWSYDPGMRPKTHTLPNGAVETRSYDAKERLQRLLTRTSGAAILSDLQYGFDRVDNRTSITYAHLGGTQAFGYDGTYRLISETRSGGIPNGLSQWGYDANGNRVLKTENGQTTTSVYDAENRLVSETAPGSLSEILKDKVDVDSSAKHYKAKDIDDGLTPDSVAKGEAWASESKSGQHWAELELKKGPRNVSRVSVWLPTVQGLVQRFKLQYLVGKTWQDLPNPQVTGAVLVSGWYRQTAHRVDFDASVSTKKLRFLQDGAGGAPSTPNQAFANEITAYEGSAGALTTLSYDPAGLLLSETGPAGTKSYGYDWGYRLASYQAGTTSAAYVTDVLGRRRMKTVGGVTEKYVYAGEDVLADYSGANALLARYTNGLGIDQKLSVARGGQSYHFVQDALGSTHMLLNASQGISNRYLTDAWGVSLQKTEGAVNRWQYAGRPLDAESGNSDNRARFYMMGRGIFGQRDPAHSGTNWRWHANANPMNGKDPWGRDTYFIGGAADYESLFGFGPTEIMGGISPEAQEKRNEALKEGVILEKPSGVMDRFAHRFPGESFYRSHAAVDEIVDAIVASRKPYTDKGTSPTSSDEQIVLIGHSWGGAAALKVTSKLKDHMIGVRLIVTLDMVSQFPVTNPNNQEAWINVYQSQTPVDYIASIPVAGQFVGGVLSLLNPLEWGKGVTGNTIATLGGQTGHESGAKNVKAKLPPKTGGATLWHRDAGFMLERAIAEHPTDFDFHGGKP